MKIAMLLNFKMNRHSGYLFNLNDVEVSWLAVRMIVIVHSWN